MTMQTAASPATDRGCPLQVKTILVPVDFSMESLHALAYATSLARQFGATIHVVHVRPPAEATEIKRAENLLLNCADALAFLQDRLAEIEREREVEFSPDHCHVFSGRPFEEICRLAHEIDADLIVLGRRGHSGLRRVLLGSTAERVIRHATCPVLVPRGKTYKAASLSARSDFSIHNILVPTDFSDSSLAGLKYAIFLAEKFQSRLHLFHAVYPYDDLTVIDRRSASLLPAAAALQRAARNEMKTFRECHIPGDLACETEIRTGSPIDQICEQSGADGNDLVVISTHGRTGLRHALIGSVAEHVARYADCPVLIVPSKTGAGEHD